MSFEQSSFKIPNMQSEEIKRESGGGKERERENEIMPIPEIIIQPERGAYLMSVMLKGYDREWGNRDHELVKLTEEHFVEHPLNPEIRKFLDEIKALEDDGMDEETLFILSLTYQHPERTEWAFDTLRRHKDIQNPEDLQQKLLEALKTLDSDPNISGLESNFYYEEIQKDIEARQKQLPEARQRIQGLVDFFQPKSQTTKIEKVNLMPTNFLHRRKSGKSFVFGKELVLMSSLEDSPDVQNHEFLHGIINPITDKLAESLSEDQKRKIIELASLKLREDYGDKYYSLLNEELIRTFVDVFARGEKPRGYKEFRETISHITSEQFQKLLSEDKKLRQRCEALGISDSKGLIKKSKDYFEKYEKDRLQEIIYDFYGDYQKERLSRPELTFEDFVLIKFPDYLG